MNQEIIIIDVKRGQAPYLITMYATNMRHFYISTTLVILSVKNPLSLVPVGAQSYDRSCFLRPVMRSFVRPVLKLLGSSPTFLCFAAPEELRSF
jgi:hypothetical protein